MKKQVLYPCILLPIALSILLSILSTFNAKEAKGFHLKKIVSRHDYNPRWDTGPLTKRQAELLDRVSSESFYYLGSEKECYVFVSQSKDLSLKFFKQHHMQKGSNWVRSALSKLPFLQKVFKRKNRKQINSRERTFTSYLLAHQCFSDQTGLLYLHLNQTKELKRKVLLHPPKGCKIELDLDKTEFLIQKQTTKLFDYLTLLKKGGETQKIKQAITSALDLITTCKSMGLGNFDQEDLFPIGFVDERPFLTRLDSLRLISSKSAKYANFCKLTEKLRLWFAEENPDLVSFLDAQIEQRIRA